MANREVSLSKRVEVSPGQWRYCSVVLSANGRVKPDLVLVGEDRHEEKHPEGAYYICWREGKKQRRVSVGNFAADAEALRLKKEAELNAIAHGVAVVQPVNGNGGHGTLQAAVTDYLAEVKLTKKQKTWAAYSCALQYFLESCHKAKLADVDRSDLLQYAAYLRDEKDHEPRTVSNNFGRLMIFLKAQDVRKLARKGDWPSFTMGEPEIYEREEIDALFAACTPEERLWFEFFLMTGMRLQEVQHTYWSDINFQVATVRVTHKPDRGWQPKSYKSREIPIPDRLVESLKAHKAKAAKGCNLVFPGAGCSVKSDFLLCLKAVVKRAGLEPDNFYLHKFRSTFCTFALRSGVDLATVQSWMGHSDLKSTMRYLKPARNATVRAKVNEIFA